MDIYHDLPVFVSVTENDRCGQLKSCIRASVPWFSILLWAYLVLSVSTLKSFFPANYGFCVGGHNYNLHQWQVSWFLPLLFCPMHSITKHPWISARNFYKMHIFMNLSSELTWVFLFLWNSWVKALSSWWEQTSCMDLGEFKNELTWDDHHGWWDWPIVPSGTM